jgi:predicted alpha-1,6-mannanase (GH76 family)
MNNKFYSSSQAIWSPEDPWWLSGVALTYVIDYMRRTNSTEYLDQVKDIIQTQRGAWNGDFRAESTDDTGWWALAMIRMYDLTGDTTYLNISIKDEAYMYQSWTSSPCGGGMYVDIKAQTYKNAIANELFIKLAASLHNRLGAETKYINHALTAWEWFQASGMLNTTSNLINDGLASDSAGACFNNKLPVWTYNQGVILGALAGNPPPPVPFHPLLPNYPSNLTHSTHTELYLATANEAHLESARAITTAVLSPINTTLPQLTNPSGILTEASCQPDERDGCNRDQQIFKGVFAANLAELDAVLPSGNHPYREFLTRNAQSAYEKARGSGTDLYDVDWDGDGGFRNSTVGKQASAVGLLVAAIY